MKDKPIRVDFTIRFCPACRYTSRKNRSLNIYTKCPACRSDLFTELVATATYPPKHKKT